MITIQTSGGQGPAGPPGADGVATILGAPVLTSLLLDDLVAVVRGGSVYLAAASLLATARPRGGQLDFSTAGNSGLLAGAL